ncbi:peptidase family C78-domain-containing protein [Mortierella sp. GBAus27b]|nr:hypothetical protein BGX31_010559 [Mortierella sp. GBA43]KAI8355811.1 peptidase family C78-domain-containing protein [Mortierella sp. GBAus27b]
MAHSLNGAGLPTSDSESRSCPMCNEIFRGDLSAFENHVQDHFADDDDRSWQGHAAAGSNDWTDTAIDETPIDQYLIDCEAPGCGAKVHILEMPEHMDRHLAEQFQTQEDTVESSKRPHNALGRPDGRRSWSQTPDTRDFTENSPRKVPRRTSPTFQAHETVENGIKMPTQTTMDKFFRMLDREPGSPGPKESRSRWSLFAPKPPPGPIQMPGLIAKARMLLEVSKTQGITKQAYLADPSVVLCRGDQADRGWGCGYRNIQMMLSYVTRQPVTNEESHEGRDNTDPGLGHIPTIAELQNQIEFAWANGFDPSGASQLRGKVAGTRKWIGTTEAWSALCSLGIRCSILEFHSPTGPNGTHPAMLSAIYNYFRSPAWSPLTAPHVMSIANYEQHEADQRIIQTSKPPLYIQHHGHSRTVVGIEILTSGEVNLLVFDPGRWVHKAIPTLQEESISKACPPTLGSKAAAGRGLLDAQYLLKAFRLSLNSGMTKAQYQLLGISGLYHQQQQDDSSSTGAFGVRNALSLLTRNASLSIGWNQEEAELSKLITSTRVP